MSKVKTIKHANHVVVVRSAECADLIDPLTGRWQTFNSQRAAKWSATVYARLSAGFGNQLADDLHIARFVEAMPSNYRAQRP